MDTQNDFYDLERLIKFRQDMHQNPEVGFKEFKTQQKIKDYLLSIKVPEQQISKCAGTGLVVDLTGRAQPQGDKRLIAFRADIDALPMKELNLDLAYRSTIGAAHMCGHDGHTACLLGFASLMMDQIDSIPSNKTIRLLFQPAEEGPGGAVTMIKEGCLDGVNEVYGCHQWPTAKIGQVWTKVGPMMSDPVIFEIIIHGKGGHASEPHNFVNPTIIGAEFLMKLDEAFKAIQRTGKKFTFCFPVFHAGEACNIIPNTAQLSGMVRSLAEGFGDESQQIIRQILDDLTQKYQATYELTIGCQDYRLTSNTETEANHILRLGEQQFGQGKANAGPCPVYASEDFGQFNHVVPGAFYFLTSGKQYSQIKIIRETNNPNLHQSNFNFNDDLIDLSSRFWLLIAKDRLLI